MWRVHGFVGRALQRCYGSNPLRLPQTHHVEDEVINSSTVLSSSRNTSDGSSSVTAQKEEDGERRKKQRTFQFGCAELPRYSALDAVGWGVATALFMQICRRIYSQVTAGTEPSPIPGALTVASTVHKCGYRTLLDTLSKRHVLPRGGSALSLRVVPESWNQEQPSDQSSSTTATDHAASLHGSSGQDHLTADCPTIDQQRALLSQDSELPEESLGSASCPLQNDGNQDNTETNLSKDEDPLSGKERLEQATLNLQHVGDNSVPVILNIIGLQSAKRESYEEAFACFLAAAQQGYNKAQFNVGVCYEKGRGVFKDRDKALSYYWQAAVGGHRQAQYRYAKLLLTTRGHHSLEELNIAINLLEQSAAAGLTEAQVCLASVYSHGLVRDRSKSVQYLRMAAESRDGTAMLFLGQCYESGFGVQQNLRTAIDYYKQAAGAGNKQAKTLLMPPSCIDTRADIVLRSIRSTPCVSRREEQQPFSSLASHPVTLPLLPRSWSTGSLCVPAALSSRPLQLHHHSTGEGTCQWTEGIG